MFLHLLSLTDCYSILLKFLLQVLKENFEIKMISTLLYEILPPQGLQHQKALKHVNLSYMHFKVREPFLLAFFLPMAFNRLSAIFPFSSMYFFGVLLIFYDFRKLRTFLLHSKDRRIRSLQVLRIRFSIEREKLDIN